MMIGENYSSWQHISFPNRGKLARTGGWTLLAVAVLLLVWVARQPIANLVSALSDQETVRAYVVRYGAFGPLVLALTQFLQVLISFIPGHLLTVAGGYLYGFVGGLSVSLVSTVVASQLAFLLARKAGRPLVSRFVSPEALERADRLTQGPGILVFALCFMIPFLPGDTINLVAGLSSMSPTRFLLASLLGRLPGAVLLTLVGSHGLNLPPEAWAVASALLVAGLMVVVGCGGWGKIQDALFSSGH